MSSSRLPEQKSWRVIGVGLAAGVATVAAIIGMNHISSSETKAQDVQSINILQNSHMARNGFALFRKGTIYAAALAMQPDPQAISGGEGNGNVRKRIDPSHPVLVQDPIVVENGTLNGDVSNVYEWRNKQGLNFITAIGADVELYAPAGDSNLTIPIQVNAQGFPVSEYPPVQSGTIGREVKYSSRSQLAQLLSHQQRIH